LVTVEDQDRPEVGLGNAKHLEWMAKPSSSSAHFANRPSTCLVTRFK
jgi:hypothetical protein